MEVNCPSKKVFQVIPSGYIIKLEAHIIIHIIFHKAIRVGNRDVGCLAGVAYMIALVVVLQVDRARHPLQ